MRNACTAEGSHRVITKEFHKQLKSRGLLLAGNVSIGGSVTFETPCRFGRGSSLLSNVEIGAFSYVGPDSEVKNVTIGRFCAIAYGVGLGPAEHPVDWVGCHPIQYNGLRWFEEFDDWHEFVNTNTRWRGNSARTTIGNDVWICRNAVVRQGVTIGDGAVIGSNSFVNRDVAPYTIVGGIPAHEIRPRFDADKIAQLQSLQWWNYMPPKGESYCFDNTDRFIDQMLHYKKAGQLRPFTPQRNKVSVQGGEYTVENH